MKPSEFARGLLLVATLMATRAQAADSSAPADLARFEREDLDVFRDKFLEVDRSYNKKTKAEALGRIRHLKLSNRAMEPIAFKVELCRIAALADNGHTECLPTNEAYQACHQFALLDGGASAGCALHSPDINVPEFNRVPLGLFPFGNDFNVVAIEASSADLLGARLLAVDGQSIGSIQGALRTFSGGTIAWRDLMAAGVLASPDQLHAVGISRHSDQVSYRFMKPNGRVVERVFKVAAADAPKVPWKWIPDPARAPWAFQQSAKMFRWRDAPELDAVIIQLRQILDGTDGKISDFLEETELNRERLGRQNVVVDMRFNGGGNFMLTREFMMRWPSRVLAPGRFFVLTSRRTFSAAITSIGYLKQSGGARVVLVGEAPGDRLMFFSEARPVQLPHTGLFFRPATARMDYQTGCRNYDDCFVAVAQPGHPTAPPIVAGVEKLERMPIAIPSLEPNLVAPWTVESWLNGSDPAMAVVSHVLGKKQ